tara:strand:+ start:73 stop:399 length:327 start_codon:yes stop_codon:yes gene_type:complete
MEKKNNPISMRPSPQLRKAVESSAGGLTVFVNGLYDNLQMMVALDAIKLTDDELLSLKQHLQGVVLDSIAIQSIPDDIDEAGCNKLTDKLCNATFGQVWATLLKYKII